MRIRPTRTTPHRLAAGLVAAISLTGCAGRQDETNRSTTAASDPSRAQVAAAESAAATQAAREAEARFLPPGTQPPEVR